MISKAKISFSIILLFILSISKIYSVPVSEQKFDFNEPFKIISGNVVKLADLNGDGLLDMITGKSGAWDVPDRKDRYYLNNGTDRPFENVEGKIFLNSPGYTYSVVTGDINNDGNIDVVLAGGGNVKYWINNGTADPFAEVEGSQKIDRGQPYAAALADINEDGNLDLIIDTRIYFHNGTSLPYENVTPFEFYEPMYGWTRDIEVADINGDGHLDLVMANMGGSGGSADNRYFLNNGTPEPFIGVSPQFFTVQASRTQEVEIADMNGDGLLDVVFGNDTEKVSRLFINNGTDIPFENVVSQTVTSDNYWTWAMGTGDLDNDGDIDIVTGNSQSWITPNDRYYLNNGNGILFTVDTGFTYSPEPLNTCSLDLGDLNRDGYLDIVTANKDYDVFVYLSNSKDVPVNPNEQVLSPTHDTFVRGGQYADQVFGDWNRIIAKNQTIHPDYLRYSYLKFDLSSLSAGDIIESAKLYLFPTKDTTADHVLFYVHDDSWNENSLTFNSKPKHGERLARWQYVNKRIEIDLTAVVQKEISGDHELSLGIESLTYDIFTPYASKEHEDNTLHPILVIRTKDDGGVDTNYYTITGPDGHKYTIPLALKELGLAITHVENVSLASLDLDTVFGSVLTKAVIFQFLDNAGVSRIPLSVQYPQRPDYLLSINQDTNEIMFKAYMYKNGITYFSITSNEVILPVFFLNNN